MQPQPVHLLSMVRGNPGTVSEVIAMLRAIDDFLPDSVGLKWFNWLYLQVTEVLGARVNQGGFAAAPWLARLDVHFASLYLSALRSWLAAETPAASAPPSCWSAIFRRREDSRLARIQFALAGINAHINHDLALAIVATCE